jgi:quercetin dioxygenase-like cupin family protein
VQYGAGVSAFDDLAAMQPLRIWDGVAARAVSSSRLTLGVIELGADAHIPEHAHENEQVGLALSGSMRFRIGEETREVAAGATWSIPANVPHEVWVGADGCVVVEAFAPGRDDWAEKERDAPRAPRWP